MIINPAIFAKCYDRDKNEIYHYKNDKNKSWNRIKCINLFNKGNKIYDIDLITCRNDRIEVFNFKNRNLIRDILFKDATALCTINQKYIIVIVSDKIKIIDKEYSFLNEEYSTFSGSLQVIKKIKIPELGECIITFSETFVKLWKI